MLAQHGFVCSMSRKGNCWDNEVVELLLEPEEGTRLAEAICQDAEAKADITDYVVGVYNCERINSALSNLWPAAYERKLTVRERSSCHT